MSSTKGRHARLRLATLDGALISKGYKSGRKRWRETPLTASTASTRSAGRPRANQLDTVPCDPHLRVRAIAVCPPTAAQASRNALSSSVVMPAINAQTGYSVNAETGEKPSQNGRMPKKAIHPASAFWRRLEEALSNHDKWHPINANNVAGQLRMSQGSVYRWFRGEGLPELETALYLAKEAGVCVDWLLNGVKPKHPISRDPVLRELFEVCEELDEDRRDQILSMAKGSLLLQQQGAQQNEQQRQNGGGGQRSRAR
jgi:hypothetical protein